MRIRRIAIVVGIVASSAVIATQAVPLAQAGRGGGGGRGQMTPEQRQAAARAAHEEEAAKPRPIDALDSVWIEELTYMEVRDAMKAGKTTALVFAGSTEQNGPYLPGGKHQYALRLVGEAIARQLGDALIAPLIPLEAGNPENEFLEWGSLYLSADTFRAVVRDVATSLKSQGFEHVMLMGDSGGNTAGLRAVAEELSAAWGDAATIHHIPEFYNWASRGGVRDFVQQNGIAEQINADGIHDEYGLTAVMMASGPKLVRYDQRLAADKLTINGVDISDKAAVAEMGRKIVEFRANTAVAAIRTARGR
jgi:creatinine amidohydrolase/Fe(II)-dependent formamide hydrolase-like protein